ncbi:GntR family transcriptional regulator [Aerococcaceae bacterium NML190938]|nr:GntR family transcriptional regulator [Aerococcaceae bacterium NML191219]MCW6667183.1 GntR family transcriptional regulator [Aerococcaceae bacterium NML190938]MCW6675026.1 GntR family transcriptional regulator [Aerococcaceae bacterium NML171108]MCW6676061.1 GntR family transcriptional regulator [Aerococcaceae bacterium NML180378]
MEFNKRLPIYEQLVQYFKQSFVNGTYRPGDILPSRRELAQQMSINPNTVQRAYKIMEEEGLIMTEANVTSRLTEDTERLVYLKQELVREAVELFRQAVQPLNLERQELLVLLTECVTQTGKEGEIYAGN